MRPIVVSLLSAVICATSLPLGAAAQRTMAVEKTQYERWMDEAPKQNKDRDEMAAGLRALKSQAEVDAFIKEMEDTECQTTENLKADDAEERKNNQATL